MRVHLLKTSSLVLSVAIFSSACENLSPGENAAVFGGLAGAATAIPLGVTGVNPGITIPVSIGAAVAAGTIAYIVAKEQASARQRKIAEQRARLYLAQQAERQKKVAHRSTATTSKTIAAAPKKSRYIAVKTVKEETSKGSDQVMIFDTQSNQIVGNNVYDLKAPPKVGQTTKFDTYSAEYVGTGS